MNDEATSKSVVISESASTVSTRGYYDLTIPEDFLEPTKQRSASTYIENITAPVSTPTPHAPQ